MIRYHFRKTKILFVGINPHHGSYRRGVPFSNNKLFWYLLARAGLVKEKVEDLRDDKALKSIYQNKFNKVYSLGLVNVINRPTRDVTELLRGEEQSGQRRICKIIRSEQPTVVCFIGKISYQKFSGSKNVSFGWLQNPSSSKMFVMHFPLHGKASVRVRELKIVKKVAEL